MKHAYAFAAGVLVIIQGLWAFVMPAEQAAWMRWRMGEVAVAVLAVIFLALQLRKQAEEEKRERKKQERMNKKRDKKIDELLRRIPKSIQTRDSAPSGTFGLITYKPSLADRTEELAHKYYKSLQDGVTLDSYETVLKPHLLELLPDLQKSPIKIGISNADAAVKHDDLIGTVRNTADKLALAAAKLSHPKMKILGNIAVLDEEDEDNDGTEEET